VICRWMAKEGRHCMREVRDSPTYHVLTRSPAQHPQSFKHQHSQRAAHIAMPSSDYTTAIGGGLKLKGAGVDKKKKKKKPKSAETAADTQSASTDIAKRPASGDDATKSPSRTPRRSLSPETAAQSIKEAGGRKKTEAERRHDETRRKRLEERLKRDGVKTHKEKVEELNKYLSGLSEHHDMPKIGPG
jgi:protein FAM32A